MNTVIVVIAIGAALVVAAVWAWKNPASSQALWDRITKRTKPIESAPVVVPFPVTPPVTIPVTPPVVPAASVPAPEPVVVPSVPEPAPVTPPGTLAETYPSAAALVAGCVGFSHAVMLDRQQVHAGFGPAKNYYTWPDGSVQSSRPQ